MVSVLASNHRTTLLRFLDKEPPPRHGLPPATAFPTKIAAALVLLAAALAAQMPQNPSPMADHTRAHQRIAQAEAPGERYKLSLGNLLLAGARGQKQSKATPLILHFHGAPWLAEWAATRRLHRCAVLTVQLGAGSAVYARPFADPARFGQLLDEAARAPGRAAPLQFHPIVLTSFSAGYGAIREILKNRANWDRLDAVVLCDGLHTGYLPEGKPGPLDAAGLEPFLAFAREAVAGRKQMLITHSEIFPGTFASTTETADWLLASLGLQRRPVVKWGALGMQQLSEVRAGRFTLLGFAGNTAPDHTDHLHALERWLHMIRM